MTPIKNQGACGACWAFAAIAAAESLNAINRRGLIPLSEQQLVDCSGSFRNRGCGSKGSMFAVACVALSSIHCEYLHWQLKSILWLCLTGGWMDYAYDYALATGGFCTAASYPYTAAQGTCKTCKRVVTISGYKAVPVNNENAMQAAVDKQPVTIAIQGDQADFMFYKSGVFTGVCGASLNHAVVVYGYSVDEGTGLHYWKIRNQWGTTWGERGYMRMVRDGTRNNGKGQCGMYAHGRYPVQ
jgi:KDEL-tailed cysteine endopeptidase